jgi:hypothetical protein
MLIAAVLAVAGLTCLSAAALLPRTLGGRYRVGRLLSATPQVSIEEALALADDGGTHYVRVTGRITSNEVFPDEHDRPLVFRRTRLEARRPDRSWRVASDNREAVPFGIESRRAYISVDEAALGDGLVVIPREAAGLTQDLPTDVAATLPGDLDPQAPARMVIEQVSAVEQATVCGRPARRNGEPVLTAGAGRPLIVTTLEVPAAMRVLARGRRGRVVASALLLLAGAVLLGAALIALLIALLVVD